MIKNLAIAFLLGICVLLTHVLVVTENQRYAYQVGLCADRSLPDKLRAWDYNCLATVETRTAWWWHLYYAVKDS
jgi:hypothetical protein